MGYTVDALIIDVYTLEERIFPAFRNGERDPIILEVIQNLIEDEKVCMMEWDEPNYTHKYEGLKNVFETFNPGMISTTIGKNFAVKDRIIEKTESRFTLPSKAHWGYEALTDLIEYTIIKYCAKFYGNLGSPHAIELLFDSEIKNKIGEFDTIIKYLRKLDGFSEYYKHGSSGYGEGISGWLSIQEVKDVHRIISKLELEEKHKHPKYRGLITLLSIFDVASNENKGILIGRDLRMTILNRYSGNVTKLVLSDHISGDGCVNFKGQIIGKENYQ